jgi:hypothetical protein
MTENKKFLYEIFYYAIKLIVIVPLMSQTVITLLINNFSVNDSNLTLFLCVFSSFMICNLYETLVINYWLKNNLK